jgi:hypothetical protein
MRCGSPKFNIASRRSPGLFVSFFCLFLLMFVFFVSVLVFLFRSACLFDVEGVKRLLHTSISSLSLDLSSDSICLSITHCSSLLVCVSPGWTT